MIMGLVWDNQLAAANFVKLVQLLAQLLQSLYSRANGIDMINAGVYRSNLH